MFQKLYKHLEEINQNTQQYKESLLHREEWSEKINEHLKAIQLSLQSPKPPRTSRILLTTNILIACLGTIIVLVLVWQSSRVSETMKAALDRSEETSRISDMTSISYRKLENKLVDMQGNSIRLDSLIEQQSKTIKELQKLNKVAIQALVHIKRDMARRQTDWPAAVHEK